MKETLLLTGATSGIGSAMAIDLAKDYNLVISGRDIAKLNQLKESCLPFGNEIFILQLDLSTIENLENELINFLNTNSISIQKFVHCAGFMKMMPLKLVSSSLLLETFSTNIFSATIIVKTLSSRKYNKSELNNVVFISSNISNYGAKAMGVYGASKSALDGMMRSLAVELAPKIRINSVLPGAVVTEMTKAIFENDDVADRMNKQYPLGIGQPNHISDAVLFLLSEKANWITGQQITVDGGRGINISG